ncbi:hypothetical protein FRB91_007720 [Serendipita sp. 411]|nr:hypothetical protein FRB91_007720 [Serendipita sp. 411]
MDPVNIPLSPDAIEQVEFYPLENTSLESSNLDDNGGGIVQAASIAVKSKRSKKQVRVLLDARTELTDKELREARDNYLQEQSRLRHEMEQQRLQKTVIERANELLYGPPDILEAEPLRQLWSNALVALIETKTGLITLVKPPRKKRPAKRRRLNGSDEHVRQVVREGIEENEGTGMDVDEVGYQAEFFGGDINTEVNTGGPEFDIRLSEVGVTLSEPEMLRAAPSRAGSINSIEFPRAQDNIEFETLHSGLFPWDNAAPSSPTPRSLAASIGNGTGRKSLDFDVIDTNVELRSLSGSRRTSVTSSQRPGSPAVPASIGEVHIDEFRFSVGEGEDVIMETQRLEAPWGKLERNLNNFFAHLKMQQNLKGDTEMTLDDIIGQEKTVRVVANAFHCVLALTTKSLVRVTQAEAFGTIFLKVVQ